MGAVILSKVEDEVEALDCEIRFVVRMSSKGSVR